MSTKVRELKKRLIGAGFEIFRVQEGRVHLADRVRENLIMDGCVSAGAGPPLVVRFVVRAQQSHFPSETEDALFDRARGQAADTLARGYAEVQKNVVSVEDPSGGASPLDIWYEVIFERTVDTDALEDELRYTLGLEKSASTG